MVVHSNTQVRLITVYMLIWDNTYLLIASYYFVDYHLCTSRFGVQQPPFYVLPYSQITGTFIHGLASISMNNNIQFNITFNNLTYTTSTNSLYDDAPQFQVRTRSCDSPYTFFNKVDMLCYVGCPDTTYPVTIYQVC